jgi:hypothetical protein
VNDVIPHFKVEEGIDRARRDDFFDPPSLLVAMEELVMPKERD